jgi:hypothetical protein
VRRFGAGLNSAPARNKKSDNFGYPAKTLKINPFVKAVNVTDPGSVDHARGILVKHEEPSIGQRSVNDNIGRCTTQFAMSLS